jgi:hypothetical protein
MNKTFEEAFNGLTKSERETIASNAEKWTRVGVNDKLDNALTRLYLKLRDRKDGELGGLSPFEEKVLARAVAAGNILAEGDDFR